MRMCLRKRSQATGRSMPLASWTLLSEGPETAPPVTTWTIILHKYRYIYKIVYYNIIWTYVCTFIFMSMYMCGPRNNLPLLQSNILKTVYLEKHVRRISQIHSFSFITNSAFLKTGSLAHASLELLTMLRIALNFWSSCPYFPTTGIRSAHHWQYWDWTQNPHVLAGTLPAKLHPLTFQIQFSINKTRNGSLEGDLKNSSRWLP